MAAEIRTFSCLNDNFGYLIHDVETKATASIDAPEAGPIVAALEREGWQLTDILITHHHGDHVGGVAELKQTYNCRVVAPHDKTTKIANVDLRVADDGIAGLAIYGQFQPDILIVDILLPGIDGPTLITSLRSHPQFARSQLIVITSLDESQRGPYAFALKGVRVIHKPRLVAELPGLLAQVLPASASQVKSSV